MSTTHTKLGTLHSNAADDSTDPTPQAAAPFIQTFTAEAIPGGAMATHDAGASVPLAAALPAAQAMALATAAVQQIMAADPAWAATVTSASLIHATLAALAQPEAATTHAAAATPHLSGPALVSAPASPSLSDEVTYISGVTTAGAIAPISFQTWNGDGPDTGATSTVAATYNPSLSYASKWAPGGPSAAPSAAGTPRRYAALLLRSGREFHRRAEILALVGSGDVVCGRQHPVRRDIQPVPGLPRLQKGHQRRHL